VDVPPLEGRVSADNYIYVRKRDDGKYGVSMRFASGYYEDADGAGEHRWEIPNDSYGVFDTAQEAVMEAHKVYRDEYIVEYGVCVGPGVIDE
jgi:hypothetical protein